MGPPGDGGERRGREKDGRPTVLWKAHFPYGIRDTIVADVDGDGFAEVIVETEEGRVHVLAAAPAARSPRAGRSGASTLRRVSSNGRAVQYGGSRRRSP